MTRIWLAATTALTLMTGVASAQSTTETTTTETTAPIVVPAPTVNETVSQRTIDSNGVVTDRTKTTTSGVAVSPYGDTTTTRRTTETTTVR